mgnify:CR=1 FL=1
MNEIIDDLYKKIKADAIKQVEADELAGRRPAKDGGRKRLY